MSGRSSRKSQVILELTISLLVVVILMVATTKIFVWMSNRLVQRDVDYNTNPNYGRVSAGSRTDGNPVFVNESNYPPLNVFK